MRGKSFASIVLRSFVLATRVLGGVTSLARGDLNSNLFAAECPKGPGSAAAACCWSSWQEWDSSSRSIAKVITTVVTTTYSVFYSENSDVPVTTLCDGIPRALKPFETIYGRSLVTTDPYTTYITPEFTVPTPACTIHDEDCKPYDDAWNEAYESWNENPELPWPTITPHCEPYYPCPSAGGSVCKIYADEATVYYWPVTVDGPDGGLCARSRTTLNPTPVAGHPITAVLHGTTFTSPSVYISIGQVSAAKHLGRYDQTRCGPVRRNVVLTLDPQRVSTQRGKPGTGSTYALNLRDLNTPVPYSAYLGQPSCLHTTNCPTIGMEYDPQLAKPTQLTGVDPEFQHCTPRSEALAATFVPLGVTRSSTWATVKPTGLVTIARRAEDA